MDKIKQKREEQEHECQKSENAQEPPPAPPFSFTALMDQIKRPDQSNGITPTPAGCSALQTTLPLHLRKKNLVRGKVAS
jgi:hypothetical protein